MKQKLHFINQIILVLLLACGAGQVKGQDYTDIVTQDTNQWIIPITQLDNCFVDRIFSTPSDNDYFDLWYSGEWFNGNLTFLGKIRTSSDNAQLFFIAPDSTDEVLIMDLNLSVNDTFSILNSYGETEQMVVDSIFTHNGLKCVQFNDYISVWSNVVPQKKMFVEGVGPNWGPGNVLENVIPPFYYICKQTADNTIYSINNETFENCDFRINSITESSNQNMIDAYPNPFSDYITISGNEGTTIYIYNTAGQLCFQTRLSNNDSRINTNHFAPGEYIIKCSTSEFEFNKIMIKK